MSTNIIMGIDPGLRRCGVAVLTGSITKPILVDSDVIATGADDAHSERLGAIHDHMERIVKKHKPVSLAVERIFINKQGNTGIGAVQVVGLVHLLGAHFSIPVVEYTPSQVKAAVTGSGTADKDAVQFMVKRMLRLKDTPKPADRADAMAVGLCHLGVPSYVQSDPRLNPHRDANIKSRLSADTRSLGAMSPRLAQALQNAGPGLSPTKSRHK